MQKENREIRNSKNKEFFDELKPKYVNEEGEFRFLKQYLTIKSAELFFASKAIFIEGTTERILLPLFIKEMDKSETRDNPLSSQTHFLEVGANAKAFQHFLEFLTLKL